MTLLHRLGASAAAHPWRTIAAWTIVLAAGLGLAGAYGGEYTDDYDVPGVSAQAGIDLLRAHFPARSGADARVVLHRDAGEVAAADVATVRTRLAQLPHVSDVAAPLPSRDGRTVLVAVSYDVPVTAFRGTSGVDALKSAAASVAGHGVQVEFGGTVPENVTAPDGTAETVGIVVALLILVFAFGSVLAAGVPLAVALIGLGVGTSGVTLVAATTDVSTFAPTVATMVGLGAGIDYALLLVTRHVEGLRAGLPVTEAAGRSVDTAGRSVLMAGATVLASLLGLRLTGLNTYTSFGYATGLAVLCVMATALTLVPAICGLAGERLRRPGRLVRRVRRERPVPAMASWAARVAAKPLPWALGALAILAVLAAPALGLRTFPGDPGTEPTDNTARRAYDLVHDAYGPGANGPLLVAVDLDRVAPAAVPDLRSAVAGTPGVASVSAVTTSPDGRAALFTAIPTTAPDASATERLLARLRSDVLPSGAYLTGWTPLADEIAQLLADRLWPVIAFVVAVALVLLTVLLRAPVVAIKAAAVNLLSVAAAYGVLVMVFQWGWGAELLGLPHAVPVSTWVPVLLFVILFGLSMDYEVFLLTRVREDFRRTGDAVGSVVSGLASTGRLITSAAAIMVAVFLGFAFDPAVTVKMMGVGMAAGVLLDATLVRLVLVPATMALLGRVNWWWPGRSTAPVAAPARELTPSR